MTTTHEPKSRAKVWLIDPIFQSISEVHTRHLESFIAENVGADAECYKLDNNDNVVWMSDIDTNARYAYFWEMPSPFDFKRYSRALVVSLYPNDAAESNWDLATIRDYLRWYDKKRTW